MQGVCVCIYIYGTCGGATAGGVLYSREPRARLVTFRVWGGVGGLVVGGGPAEGAQIPPPPLPVQGRGGVVSQYQ